MAEATGCGDVSPLGSTLEPVNILMVDDRPEGLLTLQAILRHPDYNLVTAKSGSEALAEVLHLNFAVILMDVQMPEMDGFETASIIKQRERSRNIPIIFLTAIDKDDRYVMRGYNVGAVDYLFKPFDPHVLRSKVAVFVDLFRKSQLVVAQAERLKENEMRERARALAAYEFESRRRYRSLADAMPQIVWQAEEVGQIMYFNQFWTTYSGLSLEESQGTAWQSVFEPTDLDRFLKVWKDAARDRTPFEVEARIAQAPSKTYRWHLIRVVPEEDVHTLSKEWIGSATDVHDRTIIQNRLRLAKEASEAASEAKSRFLANMSHEIRTPLGAMLGFAELLLSPKLTEQERSQSIETILRNGHQLSRLIDDILDISKVEAGKLQIERISFSLIDLANEVLALLSLSAREKGLQFSFNIKGEIPERITSDPTRVRQILLNIIGNAIKFSDRGSVVVHFELDENPQLASPQIVIDVEDTGPGLTDVHSQRLFQQFTQADSSTTRKFGGTGLGLVLSRSLARALGGDVELTKSTVGEGSVFTIRLDAGSLLGIPRISQFSNRENAKIAPVKVLSDAALSGMNILLVEDCYDNQVLVGRLLKMAGASVDVASDGREGMNKALSGNHDIVLMDIQMPEMDGYRATRELRNQGFEKPIIALTAHAMEEERQRCLNAGCNDHMTKPIKRALLLERLTYFTGRSTPALNIAPNGAMRSSQKDKRRLTPGH